MIVINVKMDPLSVTPDGIGISTEVVENFIKDIERSKQSDYDTVMRELEAGPGSYKLIRYIKDGHIRVHEDTLSLIDDFIIPLPTDIRSKTFYKSAYHNFPSPESTPSYLRFLFNLLREKALTLGYEINNVEYRLEKGFFNTNTDYWHFDGGCADYSVVVCYSNVPGWTTKIIDPKHYEVLGCTGPNSHRIEDYKGVQFEKAMQDSLFDHFYRPVELLHRAPHKEEAGDIKADDYRLFIRLRS